MNIFERNTKIQLITLKMTVLEGGSTVISFVAHSQKSAVQLLFHKLCLLKIRLTHEKVHSGHVFTRAIYPGFKCKLGSMLETTFSWIGNKSEKV